MTRINRKVKIWFFLVSITLTAAAAAAFGQSTSGAIAGRVVDATGAVIPEADVLVFNPETNISQKAVSNAEGTFVVPQLPPGHYTVIVEKKGFKKFEKVGVILSAADRLNAGDFVLAVGAMAEVVVVDADVGQLQLQSESGERSDLITEKQIRDLALNGRDLLDMMKLIPGVVGDASYQFSRPDGLSDFNVNGTRGNQKELALDGSSNVDTGSNGGRHVSTNPDAIAEVKILTSNYSAEFGKAGGASIQFVTKSGTKDYHGSLRYFARNEALNANRFFNNLDHLERPIYRHNSYGYDIGGPLRIPGLSFNRERNKLFVFWNQEFYRQLLPNDVRRLRVPTAAERMGDFSETRDGNGNRIYLRDYTKPGNCRAVRPDPQPDDQTACFNYMGTINRIDPARFFRDGPSILNLYPLPNFSGNPQYNYVSQLSNEYPRREDILRLDYNINDTTRLAARMVRNADRQRTVYGTFASGLNFPLSPIIFERPGINANLTLSKSFSPTLLNEFSFGPSRNQIEIYGGDDLITRKGRNITFPLRFPDINKADYVPNFTYGGITNQSFPSTSFNGLPFHNINATFNFTDNVTKIWKQHTIKVGVFLQRSQKDQTAFVPTNANISFSTDNTNNPYETRHPYANALLGIYNNYSQANSFLTGYYRYSNIETFIQDTWKVRRNLTLDVGLRISWYQPQYDERLQTSVFNPDFYDPAKAPRLYEPIYVNGQDQPRAYDPISRPRNPSLGNTQPNSSIGLIVPGTGDITNGIVFPGKNYPRGGFDSRGPQWGPRVGFAYDPSHKGKMVIRGGFGISYDRLQGNLTFDQITNPPVTLRPTTYYGFLDDLATPSNGLLAPPNVIGFAKDGKIPTIYSYSFGIQRDIGFKTVVDLAYVATLSRHLSRNRNLNAIPYGTTFKREAQDPERRELRGVLPDVEPDLPAVYSEAGLNYSGRFAKRVNFLRPYVGLGDINYRQFDGTANYHSMQLSVRRRYARGLTLGMAYTWSKNFTTSNGDTETSNPFNTRRYEYRLTNWDRTHVFAASYSYNLPRLSRRFGQTTAAKVLLDGWQITGISQLTTGTPFELGGASTAGIGFSQRVTGSYTEGPRFNLLRRPQPGPNGLQIDPNAFVIPAINNYGPWSRQYMRNPGVNNHDITLVKNFPFGKDGKQYAQLRMEMFNVFNHTQFRGINAGQNLSAPVGQANRDVFVNYDLAQVTDNLRSQRPNQADKPLGQFFGEYNSAREPRIIQLGIKIYF